MKIYVASSWKNGYQPEVVSALSRAGHEVYDFRRPAPGDDGFRWSEIDDSWRSWSVADYAKALDHPVAARGFASDMNALEAADLVVLVLPSGRSASWEYGYWCGKTGRQGVVHCPEKVEPELMYRGSSFTWTIDGLLSTVECQEWKPLSSDVKLAADLKKLEPTPRLPFDVWSAIGQLVVQPAVELVIEGENGSTLLTRRKDRHWDGWHIPGGFMAPGESIQGACTRTARRELGVDVRFKEVVDVVAWPSHPYVSMVSLFCLCSIAGSSLSLRDGFFFEVPSGAVEPPGDVIPVHRDFLERRARRGEGR